MALKRSDTRYLMLFYIFPVVCEDREDFKLVFHSRFEGVYVGDTNKPAWENKIVVTFINGAPPEFRKFFKKNSWAYTSYYENIKDNIHEIFAFHIPPKFKKDVNHVLNNEFCKISSAYKYHIDWISYPPDSHEQFGGYEYLNGKLKKFNPDEIVLDLNEVTKKGSTVSTTLYFCINRSQLT